VTLSTEDAALVPNAVMVETLKQYLVPGSKLFTECASELEAVLGSTV
jgi:hypothetical protein